MILIVSDDWRPTCTYKQNKFKKKKKIVIRKKNINRSRFVNRSHSFDRIAPYSRIDGNSKFDELDYLLVRPVTYLVWNLISSLYWSAKPI